MNAAMQTVINGRWIIKIGNDTYTTQAKEMSIEKRALKAMKLWTLLSWEKMFLISFSPRAKKAVVGIKFVRK